MISFLKVFPVEEGNLDSALFIRRGCQFNGSGGDTRHTSNCE